MESLRIGHIPTYDEFREIMEYDGIDGVKEVTEEEYFYFINFC